MKKVLSEDVNQKGSNITEERLRFDFNFPRPMTQEEIKKVEALVNEKISENIPVVMLELSLEEAKKEGFTGLFESKYGERVKTYSIGDFSKEICGDLTPLRRASSGRSKSSRNRAPARESAALKQF